MADGIREPLPAGWYPDPWDVHPFRRHDGHEWTNDVSDHLPQPTEEPGATSRRRRRRGRHAEPDRSPLPAPVTVSGGPVRFGAALVPPAPPRAPAARRSRVRPLLTVLAATSAGAGAWFVLTQTGYHLPFAAAERPQLVDAAGTSTSVAASPEGLTDIGTEPGRFGPGDAAEGAPPELHADLVVELQCHEVGVTYRVGTVVEPALYVLDYGDGVVVSTPRPADDPYFGVHGYSTSGHYTVKLGVLSGDGHVGAATCTIDRP